MTQVQIRNKVEKSISDHALNITKMEERLNKTQRAHIIRGEAELNDRRARARRYNEDIGAKARSASASRDQQLMDRTDRFFNTVDNKLRRSHNFVKYRDEMHAVVPPEMLQLRRPSTAL